MRLLRKHPRVCWGVSFSGAAAADPGEWLLSERVVRMSGMDVLRWDDSDRDAPKLNVGGDGAMIAVYADYAVEAVLEYLERDVDGGEVGFAELYPIRSGEHDLDGGMLVIGESGGTPAVVVSAADGVAAAEFRPRRGRAGNYAPLGDAVDVVRRRLGWLDSDLRAAVVPRIEDHLYPGPGPSVTYVGGARVGEIHAEYGDEVRVWPMDWNGLLDAFSVGDAVEAAAAQLNEFLERAETTPDGRLVGRLFFVDSSNGYGPIRLEESVPVHCYDIALFPGREVWTNGEHRVWSDPFDLDSRTAESRGFATIGGV